MEFKKTEREKMTNGEPFFTNDPQLMEDKKNGDFHLYKYVKLLIDIF